MKAIFYNFNYYLLPDEYDNVKDFLERQNLNKPVPLRHLYEKDCMAPYFVSEEIALEEVLIVNPHRICEVDVEILPRQLYDDTLREGVKKFCVGCSRYSGDASDLNGHFDELSLDRVCYEKEYEDDYEFQYATQYFWMKFSEMKGDLEKLIDKGKLDKAVEKVSALFQFMMAPYLSFSKKDNKYVLMMSGLGNELVRLLSDYLVRYASEVLKETWEFYSYLPQDIYIWSPDGKKDLLTKKKPMLYIEKEEFDRPRFNIMIILPNKSNVETINSSYLYLCQEVGENRLEASLNHYYFVTLDGVEVNSEEKLIDVEAIKDNLITPIAFSSIIEETYHDEKYENIFNVPSCFSALLDMHEAPKVDREDVEIVNSIFPELDVDILLGQNNHLSVLDTLGITVGTLYFHIPLYEQDAQEELDYLSDLIDTQFKKEHLIINFSIQMADERIFISFLSMNQKLVRKKVRDLTPIFKAYDAIYEEITQNTKMKYRVGYTLVEL